MWSNLFNLKRLVSGAAVILKLPLLKIMAKKIAYLFSQQIYIEHSLCARATADNRCIVDKTTKFFLLWSFLFISIA